MIETDSAVAAAAAFRNVTFRYPGEQLTLIENLDFTIRRGEFVSLVGPSGCGKSTIFRLLNRLNEPLQGTVETFAKDTEDPGKGGSAERTEENRESSPIGLEKNRESSPAELGKTREGSPARKERNRQNKSAGSGKKENVRCGYMPQQDMLFPWRTVAENVRLPLELRGGMREAEMNERAAKALKDVGLEGWGDKLPRELSGGMRQRASFARTLMTGADLLLLDEPFSALDYLTRLSMREWLLKQWEKDKKTVLFITHDVEEAIILAQRVVIMHARPGRVKEIVDIDIPYPRDQATKMSPRFLELKNHIWKQVYEEYLAVRK